mmetsp:Transcript_18753/g.43797  ORF Transcript_18753/g.43797 Transcript_18753/m.43797 type:complete len:105 (-) Transcript_18753:131-445(-)
MKTTRNQITALHKRVAMGGSEKVLKHTRTVEGSEAKIPVQMQKAANDKELKELMQQECESWCRTRSTCTSLTLFTKRIQAQSEEGGAHPILYKRSINRCRLRAH